MLILFNGCTDSKDRMSTFDPKGPLAEMQLDLFMVTVWVTLFLFITVGGTLLTAVVIFREKKSDKDKPLPKQAHGHPLVEIGLIGFSTLLLVIIAIPTVQGIWEMHEMPINSEKDYITVNVTGYQWWWKFEYPEEGITTANELVIPVNKVIKLNLRTADVIHSFWLPKLAGKTDLMPGRKNWMWIQANEEGHYYGQCLEFCGEAHAYMLFRSDVVSQSKFDNWVDEQLIEARPPAKSTWQEWYQDMDNIPKSFANDPIQDGARLYMTKGGCIECHTIDGSMRSMGVLGPNLTHLASRKSIGAGLLDNRPDPDNEGPIDSALQLKNFVHWISKSEDVKPGNLMYERIQEKNLTPDEFEKIAKFLQTLK